MVALVALAACGSSTPARTASTSPPPSTAPSTSHAATTSSYPRTTSHTSTAGASDVRLPATFTIRSGGKLTPASVSAPAGVLIGLTVIAGDGQFHRVTIGRRMLIIPAGRRTYTALQGFHAGRYPVIVDGVLRGLVVVGGKVGP